jgi:cytosine/adenosine deaminase-related metal-dependent hydrolase
MTLYLTNATFIDWQTLEFKTGHLAVSTQADKPVEFIHQVPTNQEWDSQDQVIDCRGKLVTKSFGCGHHHIYSTLARGMPAPSKTPSNFLEILDFIWWRLDKNLDLAMIKASALASALYCAKNGVTFVIDHHASPLAVKGSLAAISEAFDAVGISHLLCYEITDRDGELSKDQGLEETEVYLQSGRPGLVGLHASFTVSDQTIKQAVDLALRYHSGIHVHVAEDKADQDHCLRLYQTRVMNRFHKLGVLDLPKTILAHCVHLDNQEQQLLKDSRAWVAENIESNLNNAVGLSNYSRYGDRIMLGTDGMHSDMLRSARMAFFVGQTTEQIGMDKAYRRFRAVHDYLKSNGFQGDSGNNLVILDYDAPTELHAGNFLGHFLFGLESKHVWGVIANGKLIVRDRILQTMNETEILGFAREMGNRLWRKL